MTPFGRFLVVFGLAVLAVCLLVGGNFSIFGAFGTFIGFVLSIVGTIIGTVIGGLFGLFGLVVALVGLIPLLIPVLILAAPLLFLVGLIALISRAARN